MRTAVVLLTLTIAAPAVADVSLNASSGTAAHAGDTVEICVSLSTGGVEVAGTQNDLVWDGECASLPDAASCAVAGTHGKTLFGHLVASSDFAFRALVLSLTDVSPIDDGVLYCCSFIAEAAPGACCPIGLRAAATSDPQGRAIPTLATDGALCVASGTAARRSSEDDGCAIVPAHGRGGIWILLLGAVALRLLALRGRGSHRASSLH